MRATLARIWRYARWVVAPLAIILMFGLFARAFIWSANWAVAPFVTHKASPASVCEDALQLPAGAGKIGNRIFCPDCPPVGKTAPCPPTLKRQSTRSAATAAAPVAKEQPAAETNKPQPLCCGQDAVSPDEYRRQYEAWVERK